MSGIKEVGDGGGVLISIFVKPNSSKFAIEIDDEGIIVVYATEEPERGKVNKEILRELTKLFHAKVELVSGATFRQKQVIIMGVKKEVIEQVLKKK
jgi:uncharacterized protein (TIGR00251 family)